MRIVENDKIKTLRSENYNFNFNKSSGYFERWGETKSDDPLVAPAPEILDIEVSEICAGIPNSSGKLTVCNHCYKSNTKNGKNMSFKTFKTILDKFPKNLTQIAIGSGAGGIENPDLFRMMEYSRSKGIIPNITVANITDDTADNLAMLCGAVSVSCYKNYSVCYDSVKKLTDRGLKQVNIHQLVSKSTYDQVFQTIRDAKNDSRLFKLNSIVLLSLKKIGRGINHESISREEFKKIIDFAFENKVRIGFDTCSYDKFEYSIRDNVDYDKFIGQCENCEATRMSAYVNVEGKFFPCSFCEEKESFPIGLDVIECENFVDEIWNHERTNEWRERALEKMKNGDMSCSVYEV